MVLNFTDHSLSDCLQAIDQLQFSNLGVSGDIAPVFQLSQTQLRSQTSTVGSWSRHQVLFVIGNSQSLTASPAATSIANNLKSSGVEIVMASIGDSTGQVTSLLSLASQPISSHSFVLSGVQSLMQVISVVHKTTYRGKVTVLTPILFAQSATNKYIVQFIDVFFFFCQHVHCVLIKADMFCCKSIYLIVQPLNKSEQHVSCTFHNFLLTYFLDQTFQVIHEYVA